MKVTRKISNWWKWKARFFYRDFTYGIKNLIKWFPVIWRDRDWDDYYIWEILKFKLTNQANTIRSNDIHTHARYDADKMMLCVRLIDKIQREYYAMEFTDYQETDFEFIKDKDSNLTSVELKQKSENFDDYFKKYSRLYKQMVTKFPDKSELARFMSYENHIRAKRILFKLMEENIERWWD